MPCLLGSNDAVLQVCHDALLPGSRNRRRNTSLLITFEDSSGSLRHVVIDCSKSFYDSVITYFPQHNVRTVDGVLLTHDHADAVLGLDDLRMFTLRGPQDVVHVHCHRRYFAGVQRMFPYIVDAAKATGGGQVPAVDFHVFESSDAPVTVAGLAFQPIEVWHGPDYICLGYRFDDIVYISDVSGIPDEAAAKIAGCKVLIVDALRTPLYEEVRAANHVGRLHGVPEPLFCRPGDRGDPAVHAAVRAFDGLLPRN